MAMENDINGVRINPPVVEFYDSEPNQTYRVTVSVKNVSKTSKTLRFYGPNSKVFRMKAKNPEKPIAPGLEVQAIIEFDPTEEKDYKDRMLLAVDGEGVEIPLVGIPSKPMLQLEGPVDFGNVVASSKVIAKEISLFNHGTKCGEFKIKYAGEKPISIIPSSGTVPPRSAQSIKIEYVTKQSGSFQEEAKVKLEGQESTHLVIQGNVVEGVLELVSTTNEAPVECVKFGPTYYGTDKTESAFLINNGPEPVKFVAVLDEDAVGQETGVDLSKSTVASLASNHDPTETPCGYINPLTSLVTAIPTQGMLGPYEKIPIFFRFSPRWNPSKQGYKSTKKPPPRKDFALFMKIQMIGSSKGFQNEDGKTERSNVEGAALEIALTGTALPVQLVLSPQTKFDFEECPVGEHVDALCNLRNENMILPVTYQFKRIAHFSARPPNGKIGPGQAQDIIFSFTPNQVGTFKQKMQLEVIGQVADNKNPFLAHLEPIHCMPLSMVGRSDPVTIKREPKFNPGITPKVVGEVGQFVDTTFQTAEKHQQRAALLNSKGTKLHKIKTNRAFDDETTYVAFPNDRAGSIRPTERHKEYRTIFTKMERYNFVDPDYAYTDEETKALESHKQYYVDCVEEMRKNRINRLKTKEFIETNNKEDIGIKIAAGIKPKKLTQEEIRPDTPPAVPPNTNWQVLSSKHLAQSEMMVTQKKVKEGLNAVPITPQEKADCSMWLSPQQLHQVVIGPPTIDFEEVCLRSNNTKDLNIVNNLDQYIHVVVEIDCRELRQTSPLSQVVPPMSRAKVPIIFESNTRGKFQRSVDYTINGFYKNHVIVLADVVPVALHLSTNELLLTPSQGLPAEAGFRGIITLSNVLNYPAEFTWQPILGELGTAFSIRPATGTVDAFTDLDCEVVFHPSFMAPDDGKFALQVHGGNGLHLKCKAEFGPTNVQFIERRVLFGQVPLHMSTVRRALLHNNSQHHAYFQVLDPNPFEGMIISPAHGVVPVGGNAELLIALMPHAVMKFDTKIQVAIRGWKTLELRMGGTVEPPCVDIDMSSFNLGGVYVGSSSVTNFKVKNKTHTEAKVEFDLSRYTDFKLRFPNNQTPEDLTFELLNPGMHTVTLAGQEEVEAELIFTPTEVASYDFIIPVVVNATGAPSPAPTPFPPTPAPSAKNTIEHIINPKPIHVTIATPRRKVVATALRQPFQISHSKLEFTFPNGFTDQALGSGLGQNKGTLFINNSDKTLKWTVDVSCDTNRILDRGIFKFLHSSGMPYLNYQDNNLIEGTLEPGQTQSLGVLFCPNKAGKYEIQVPIIINDEEKPYSFLELSGELKSPRVWFDPLALVLTPVPLTTDVSAEFKIFATDYNRKTVLDVELPEVECEDGSRISPLTVIFKDGQELLPVSTAEKADAEPFELNCKVVFSSPKPISFTADLKFVDSEGNSFGLPVTATADNSLFTAYPFLASHRSDHLIVCEQGRHMLLPRKRLMKGTILKGQKTESKESLNVGEAVFVPVSTPHTASRPSTSATSSNFEVSSSSYEDSTQSLTETNEGASSPREGAMVKLASDSSRHSKGRGIASRSLGSAMFPDEDTEEGLFYSEVLLAVQRWFSSQGWPGGPYPIVIPYSLRAGVAKNQKDTGGNRKGAGSWDAQNLRKEIKTIYDMIGHLAGRPVPGIPINAPLPSDPTERALQVHWQHSTLLTFLKSQGASVASIKPEYLMTPGDYKHWIQVQKQMKAQEMSGQDEDQINSGPRTENEEMLEDQLFEAVSKRAWTDLMLQLLKTLVLSRITPRQFRTMQAPDKHHALPTVNPDPLSSNVYCVGERIVLAWLNHCYEQYRHHIWDGSPKGGVPPSRWIVNFDFDLLDGLVLGACLGAYVPFLIKTHLQGMYSCPTTAEQCLHNALKVVNAIKYIGLDYDIQAIDITDPNPINLLLLCIHLYQKLPHYLPKSSIEFTGSLHSTVMRQIRLSNPSAKPLTYQCLMAGRDARDFNIPKGDVVTIPPKSNLSLAINFTSRFLRPTEAMLVLVGRRAGSSVGSTLVFNLQTQVNNISPKSTLKCSSNCYELHKITLKVTNPFNEAGEFRVVLVEAKGDILGQDKHRELMKPKKKKVKKIKSRTDHGQTRPETPPTPEEEEPEPVPVKEETKENVDPVTMMSAYYSPYPTIFLGSKSTGEVELHFLPFHTGVRQCSVIFINENIGEFLYSVEAEAELPLPSSLPFKPSLHSVRISSAAAAGRGRGMFGGDDDVIYWKCEANQSLTETISVPVTNAAREKALVIAGQQHMSELEIQRRKTTGTLATGTVTARAFDLLSTSGVPAVRHPPPQSPEGTVFTVEIDSPYFAAPATLTLPNPLYRKARTAMDDPTKAPRNTGRSPAGLHGKTGVVLDEGSVELPITFAPSSPGHYPCRVVLKSQDDIRVYRIECTVNPEGSNAELEFTAPVHQSIMQDIPIINQTHHDWPLEANIDGMGFCGPPTLLAKACQTSYYPLMFRPQYESEVEGLLILKNKSDGTEHSFHLRGHAKKPLPLDHVVIQGEVKQTTEKTVQVPNVTRKKLTYRVQTDLPFVSGGQALTILPGQTGNYNISVCPLKRGRFKGVLAFVAGRNPITEVDSDGDEEPGSEAENEEYHGYTVWYSVDMHVKPAAPEKTLELGCACQKSSILEVGVRNPTDKEINLDVTIEGPGLSGAGELLLQPGEKRLYELQYSPAIIGKYQGSLIFYNEVVGEFWYDLCLTAESPRPTTLPHMECELGRWTKQTITLNNPTDEILELIPTISNTNNFTLERDNERPISLRPHTQIKIPLHFMPSNLGQADHNAKITFHSEQLGEWVYIASGTGLLPQPQDPVCVYTPAGSNSTLIIPFRNPLDHAVMVDVTLTDKDQQMELYDQSRDMEELDSPFCLLLKNKSGIRVGPKSTLDIPVSFAPEEMKMYEALCVAVIRKEDGSSWHYNVPESYKGIPLNRTTSSGIRSIRWIYPVNGIPESHPMDSQATVVECQARGRIEERLEVTLSGVAPSSAGPQRGIRARAITPKGKEPQIPEGIVVGEGLQPVEEFTYEIQYDDADDKDNLKHSVALNMIRQYRDKTSGLVVLVFNIVFAPYKQMMHDVKLMVKSVTGGVWKFPVRFIATEPQPDDVIEIEALGLNKESNVGFRLTSQTTHPTPYNAYFLAGSDAEFKVYPQSGELLPVGSNGTLISVSFTPGLYGKLYQAKLVVQTPDMQWTYSVRGVLPEYTPPRGASSRPIAGPHPDPRRRGERMNYVRENLKLTTTAVSSPVKGAPILPKSKYM
ncbi:cilia- and flagella-associated protein 47 isoform X1 [Lingula anatina]|uniref:Cilia- and flagella-associated protein 47 isoform X1 n=1 Tax=Lingula anatina TaxID=7574 RepID=A0A1S3K1X4_LINAN|nr:cilia- and flagella-associated protein 47 isoform X1 [Lingula anatina]|eukprot:XP_013416633.1 cilia- and flagella-associated protein 47 isoform X1 [Lingula anatina]